MAMSQKNASIFLRGTGLRAGSLRRVMEFFSEMNSEKNGFYFFASGAHYYALVGKKDFRLRRKGRGIRRDFFTDWKRPAVRRVFCLHSSTEDILQLFFFERV